MSQTTMNKKNCHDETKEKPVTEMFVIQYMTTYMGFSLKCHPRWALRLVAYQWLWWFESTYKNVCWSSFQPHVSSTIVHVYYISWTPPRLPIQGEDIPQPYCYHHMGNTSIEDYVECLSHFAPSKELGQIQMKLSSKTENIFETKCVIS